MKNDNRNDANSHKSSRCDIAVKSPKAKPVKPSQYECCGRGCRPCVFDYYEQALMQWRCSNSEVKL